MKFNKLDKSTIHEGQILRKFLRDKDISVEEAAEKIGSVKTTVYNWIAREALSLDQKERLKKAGYEIRFEQKFNEVDISTPSNLSELDKEILRLQSIIEEKNNLIAAQTKIIKLQEHLLGGMNKKVAHMIHPKSRRS